MKKTTRKTANGARAAIHRGLALVLYMLLAADAAALLLMTILASAGVGGVWEGAPITVVLTVLGIALSIAVVAFNPKKNIYSIGFYALHFGIILFLLGSFIYSQSGVMTHTSPPNVESITPVMEYQMMQNGASDRAISTLKGYYNRVKKSDGSEEIIDLGFNFRIISFETELYEDGAPKHYEATVEFLNTDGSTDQQALTVNHPIYRNGWKIYLMDVGANSAYGFQEVRLMLKSDPAEPLSNAGIILTITGTFLMCFIRPRSKSVAKASKKKKIPSANKGGEAI